MLMGAYENQIDAKNRMIIPAKIRDEFGHKCILTKGLDDCLILYPLSTWEEQQKTFAALPRSDAKVRAFLRYTYANAHELDIDKQWRILFPQELIDFAHIERDLKTIGMIDRVEIWAKETYENSENGGLLTSEDMERFSEEYKV